MSRRIVYISGRRESGGTVAALVVNVGVGETGARVSAVASRLESGVESAECESPSDTRQSTYSYRTRDRAESGERRAERSRERERDTGSLVEGIRVMVDDRM